MAGNARSYPVGTILRGADGRLYRVVPRSARSQRIRLDFFARQPRTEARATAYMNCPDGTCRRTTRSRTVLNHIPIARTSRQRAASRTYALPHADAIQRAINNGAGRSAGKGMCARAVWRILYDAGLVRGNRAQSGADAKWMGPILRSQGFIRDNNVCNRPGVVRIYDGNRSGRRFRKPMTGDRVGHIEILGTDNQYHSFMSSPETITQSMQRRFGYGSRRPLMECWYKP